jgi:hypothetical protein
MVCQSNVCEIKLIDAMRVRFIVQIVRGTIDFQLVRFPAWICLLVERDCSVQVTLGDITPLYTRISINVFTFHKVNRYMFME